MRPWAVRATRHLRSSGERAQDVVEYGLLIAVIAVVVLVGIRSFGSQIEPWFHVLAGQITTTGTQ